MIFAKRALGLMEIRRTSFWKDHKVGDGNFSANLIQFRGLLAKPIKLKEAEW